MQQLTSHKWTLARSLRVLAALTIVLSSLGLSPIRAEARLNLQTRGLVTHQDGPTASEFQAALNASADAAPVKYLSLVGQAGGTAQAVAVQGPLAYLGVGQSLIVVDVSDPNTPSVIGKSAPLVDTIEDLVVQGRYAYALSFLGLDIIDVSNPVQPVQIGTYGVGGVSLAVANGHAFIATRRNLHIVDVSSPGHPATAAVLEGVYAVSVAARGRYLYGAATSSSGQLVVIDIARPANPRVVSSLSVGGSSEMTVLAPVGSDYVYLALGPGGMAIIDVINPLAPRQISMFRQSHGAYSLAVAENRAFVGDSSRRVYVVDISNPVAPVAAGSFYDPELTGYASDLATTGGLLYAAFSGGGFVILDAASSTGPVGLGMYDSPEYASYLDAVGSLVYLIDAPSTLRVVDLTDPVQSIDRGSYAQLGMYPYAITVEGAYAYVADGYDGVRIIRVSNPAAMIQVAQIDPASSAIAEDIALSEDGSLAYAVYADFGLNVIGVSNPANPVQRGSLWIPSPKSVAVSGHYVYVATYHGLYIVDVLDSSHPTLVAVYATDSEMRDVAVSPDGAMAYVAVDQSGMEIVDVSSPTGPTRIGLFTTDGTSTRIEVTDQRIYLADSNGLHILDRVDPARPSELAYYAAWGQSNMRDLAVENDRAFLSDGRGYVHSINIAQASPPHALGGHTSQNWATTLAVQGRYAYVDDWSGGFYTIDISDPAAPEEIGSVDLHSSVAQIAVASNGLHVYVAGGMSGLRVISVANPALPEEVGSLPTARSADCVAAKDATVYLAGDLGFQIIDVSQPSQPVVVGALDFRVKAMAVANNYAFLLDNWDTYLHVIDISNPTNPTEVASLRSWDRADTIAIDGSRAYVSERNSDRVVVVDLSVPTDPQQIGQFAAPDDFLLFTAVDNYVYGIANGVLSIYDARNLAAVRTVVRYRNPIVSSLVPRDGFIYVAQGDNGLGILEWRELTNPVYFPLVHQTLHSYP